jgi:hypothetical protein
MSQHGMVPPDRHPRRGEWSSRRAVLGFAAQVLVREAVIGAVLYACAGASRIGNFGMGLLALGMVVLWTYWFGLLRPRSWTMAAAEGLLLYAGSVCIGNILLITLGPLQWASGP